MAKIFGTGANLLDSILPVYGNPRVNTPIWNESQHMFITDQYTSAAGNTYYLGVRFSDRFVSILHIGLYHNWTYINEVDVYVFNGREHILAGKERIDKFYDESLVRSTIEGLLRNYIEGQMVLQGTSANKEMIEEQVKGIVEKSYCSMIHDPEISNRIEAVKPLLVQSINKNL